MAVIAMMERESDMTSPVSFLLALIILLIPGGANAQNINSDIYGRWRVSSNVTQDGAISSKTDREVRAMIGRVADIGPHRFAFNGKICKKPVDEHSVDDTLRNFDREWRINPTSLPFGDNVTAIDVGCDLYTIYPVDRRRLIIADDGVFLEAVRIGNPASAP